MNEGFAFTARVLGALFYFAPDSEQAAPLVTALTQGDWQQDWPLPPGQLAPIADALRQQADESLPDAWQRLFIGPWALPAPPWGSVWLDRESVLFGDSTLALRQWMRDNGIAFEMAQNEPEDRFGTLLLLAAWLAVEHPFSRRVCRKRGPPVLPGAGTAGAADAGRLAVDAVDPGGGEAALSLTLCMARSPLVGEPCPPAAKRCDILRPLQTILLADKSR